MIDLIKAEWPLSRQEEIYMDFQTERTLGGRKAELPARSGVTRMGMMKKR